MRIAFCGLGLMGAPMAERLVDAGHDVVVWNRTPEKAERLVERGAQRAATPAEAGSGAEAAVTMLSDPDAVRAVVLGPDGLAAGLGPRSVLIEMSTVGPEVVREVREGLPDHVDMVDAPVRGSIPQAMAGELKILVGGDREAVDRVRPVIEVLGTSVHLGPLGTGAAMKLVANLTIGVVVTAFGEALALADALGLDRAATLEMLAETPIGSLVPRVGPSLESGDWSPRFKLELAQKDLRVVSEEAGGRGERLPLAEAAHGHFADASKAGFAELDYTAVVAHLCGDPRPEP
jgi:3-hydroxyisobutyrate dehydrogenase-like beta-hydroxyacid dehydrogenase